MNQEVKSGSYLLVDQGEYGEYSDYHVIGIFVALQDFDVQTVLKEHLGFNAKASPRNRESFVSFLIRNEYLVEIDHDTLYLGRSELKLEPELIRKSKG